MNNLNFACRQLRKSPGFTAVAIVVLGLGIGANTAIFSLINALLFKPLVMEQPQSIVRLHSRSLEPDQGFRSFSYPNYLDIRDRNTVFEELTAFSVSMIGLNEGDTTRRVFASAVAANYFRTFGVRPALGRTFLPEEERPGAGIPSAMVSFAYWQRMGGSPAILESTVELNGRTFQVVGVTPEGFTGTSALLSSEVYVPLGVQEWLANDFTNQQGRQLGEREQHCLLLVGRLRSAVSPKEATRQLEPLAEQLREAFPAQNHNQTLIVAPPARLSLGIAPASDREIGGLTALLMPMAGVVLIIACLNLANMLLARGTARQKEFAIRAALGGERRHIIGQLVTEGVLLSLAGGVLALVLSNWIGLVLRSAFTARLPSVSLSLESGIDGRVLAATFGFCLLATLLTTLVPALRLSKVDVVRDLKEHDLNARGDSRLGRFWSSRNLMVVGQVSLSFVLLVVAGLFFRGAVKAAEANPGFRFEQGVVVELDPSLAGYTETQSRQAHRAILERVRAMPGVFSASLASSVPFGLFSDSRMVGRPGTRQAQQERGTLTEAEQPVYANYVAVSDDYFRSLGTPLLQGREFSSLEVEGTNTTRAAILNTVLAERLWPGQTDIVGRQVEILDGGQDSVPLVAQVVGLAPGFKAAIGDTEPAAFLYLPLGQAFQSMVNLHVRLPQPDPVSEQALLVTLRSVLREVDDRLPVISMNTLRDFHQEGLAMWLFRTASRLFLAFGLLALSLAAVGLYGVKAFVVERRTREIGLRMALGASRWQVLWLVLRGSLQLTGAGLALGGLMALLAGHLLRSALFGVSATDVPSFGVAFLILVTVALLAGFLPAQRATRIDPLEALRNE